MNEKYLAFVKEYTFDKPLIQKIDFLIDKCHRDCHDKYFCTFEYTGIYNSKLTNTSNNEIVILTTTDKRTVLYELKTIWELLDRNGLFLVK